MKIFNLFSKGLDSISFCVQLVGWFQNFFCDRINDLKLHIYLRQNPTFMPVPAYLLIIDEGTI